MAKQTKLCPDALEGFFLPGTAKRLEPYRLEYLI